MILLHILNTGIFNYCNVLKFIMGSFQEMRPNTHIIKFPVHSVEMVLKCV